MGQGVTEGFPPPLVDYTQVLRGSAMGPMSAAMGIALGIVLYVAGTQVIASVILYLYHAVRGIPTDYGTWAKQALAYEYPVGMLAGHVGLAFLIPLSIGLVWRIHRVQPRWLASVQPGMRWRFLLLCAAIAVVVLNGVMWLSRVGQPTPWAIPTEMWAWLALILLTSPLQAAGEEYFFRGYLLQAFGSFVPSRWFGVVTSAFIFAVFHGTQNVPLFIDRFAFGLLAGWLVVVTGGIEAGIAAHVINNLFAFGYALFMGGVASARAVRSIGWMDAAWDVAGFALFAAAAWWLGRRLNVADRTPADPVLS
ncbi:MAG TPA: type II CAAX endopeptidase family protein [Propionibacteriaceae bacterium]|nr:type II CAAX endopeptidase family protein [Propionibacteriaceae bacterium]